MVITSIPAHKYSLQNRIVFTYEILVFTKCQRVQVQNFEALESVVLNFSACLLYIIMK